jgi:transcriptional regulator with XRE-family HTH domain
MPPSDGWAARLYAWSIVVDRDQACGSRGHGSRLTLGCRRGRRASEASFGKTEPGSASAAQPRGPQLLGVLVHPLAGNPESARDLQRIEPFRLAGRLWAEALVLEDLEDARSNGVAESVGDLLERGWIELERLGLRHIGNCEARRLDVSTALPGRGRDVSGPKRPPVELTCRGMPRNHRLADAIRSSGRSVEDLAADVGAHPKTLERWVSSGRLPHAALRLRLAALLGVPVPMLWPEVPGVANGVSEVVGIYATRNEVSPAAVGSMVDAAGSRIDVLVYSGMWLWDTVPRFHDRLLERITAGVTLRICLGDPSSEAVRLRGEEEGSSDAMVSRCKIAIDSARRLLDADPTAVRLTGATLYSSMFRFDDEVLVNTHLWGNPAAASPVLHLRSRAGEDGIAANARRSFERVWDRAQALAG